MKLINRFMLLAILGIALGSCKKDEPAPAATLASQIQGNWAIADSEGTEWKEGEGVITPRTTDPSMVGLMLVIEGTTLSVKNIAGASVAGPLTFTLNETEKSILIGDNANTGLGKFFIKNLVVNASMDWEQREPISEDYTPQAGCGCNLYFQKFWTLSKML